MNHEVVQGPLTRQERATEHTDLRWDEAIQIALDETQLDHVRAEKQKAKRKSGDFTDADADEDGGDDGSEPEEGH